MITRDQSALLAPVERDLRLDLFRGIGLWMIFLDHIPHDVVAWLTLAQLRLQRRRRILRLHFRLSGRLDLRADHRRRQFSRRHQAAVARAWQMYVAHIMLFLLFTAQIARTVRKFDNPMYEDEFNVHNFLAASGHPDRAGAHAALQAGRSRRAAALHPLVLAAPLILWGLVRRPNLTLLAPSCCTCWRAGSTGISPPIRRARTGTSIRSAGN